MPDSALGRPRDQGARTAVLTAARDLVAERGYDAVTIVEIASRAGVGRQTIYRWWSSKHAIVAESVTVELLPIDPIFAEQQEDLDRTLQHWVERSLERLADTNAAALYRAMLAAAALDASALARLDELLAAPLRAAIELAFAQEGRESEAAVAADILVGAMINAILTRDVAARERLRDVVAIVAGKKH